MPTPASDTVEPTVSARIIDVGPEYDSAVKDANPDLPVGTDAALDERIRVEEKSGTGPVTDQPSPIPVPKVKGPSDEEYVAEEAGNRKRNAFHVTLEILSDIGSLFAILAVGICILALLT